MVQNIVLRSKVRETIVTIFLIILLISYFPFNVMGTKGSGLSLVLFQQITTNINLDDWQPGVGNGSIWLIKTDEEGDIEWDQVYGGKDADLAYALIQTTDGGFALAGTTFYNELSPADHLSDIWLIKMDGNGSVQWNQTYGDTPRNSAYTLIQTVDGGFALAGGRNYDMWLVKIDRNGSVQWHKVYGGVKKETAYALVQTTDGGFALAGTTSSYGAGGDDIWLVKTNTSGEIQWQKTYGSIYDDFTSTLIQTDDGNIVLAGNIASPTSASHSTYLVKINSNGVMKWNQTYNISQYSLNYALIQTNDNGFGLAGWILPSLPITVGEEMWFVKTDSNGNVQWNQTYGGMDGDIAYSLIQTKDGGFALAGSTRSYGASRQNMWLVKTDSTGVILWNQSFGGTQKDYARALLQTADGGFVLLGTTESYGVDDNISKELVLSDNIIFGVSILISITIILITLKLFLKRKPTDKSSKK